MMTLTGPLRTYHWIYFHLLLLYLCVSHIIKTRLIGTLRTYHRIYFRLLLLYLCVSHVTIKTSLTGQLTYQWIYFRLLLLYLCVTHNEDSFDWYTQDLPMDIISPASFIPVCFTHHDEDSFDWSLDTFSPTSS